MGTTQSRGALTEFGERIRHARLRLGMSQEGLAEAVAVHRTYVGTVERGQRNPALLNILRLSAALQVDPATLIAGLRP